MLVINKIDVMRLEDLPVETRTLVQEIIDAEGVQCVQVSCYSEEGVMDLKNKACDALLAQRVETKLKGTKINTILNRIHVAQPKARDDIVRAPFIPEGALSRKKYEKSDPERRKLARDIEAEEGGAGVYNIDMKSRCIFSLFLAKYFIKPHCRGLLTQNRRMEGRCYPRNYGWQEHC
jgi:nucleolar GTP-binding protein